ncbi:hypothetical protein HYFRA_00012249 [Hymenoscyphus fraxineus]|uniref:Uncharacterized protein n=1 Tax=Hymenoscyphus fraxineus TaxID=746836 RepID=A0A9N9PUY2_9HELO|nr:hypothetical protein HYFRA_00012249 [Hymenoscyphus fraxineus]
MSTKQIKLVEEMNIFINNLHQLSCIGENGFHHNLVKETITQDSFGLLLEQLKESDGRGHLSPEVLQAARVRLNRLIFDLDEIAADSETCGNGLWRLIFDQATRDLMDLLVTDPDEEYSDDELP